MMRLFTWQQPKNGEDTEGLTICARPRNAAAGPKAYAAELLAQAQGFSNDAWILQNIGTDTGFGTAYSSQEAWHVWFDNMLDWFDQISKTSRDDLTPTMIIFDAEIPRGEAHRLAREQAMEVAFYSQIRKRYPQCECGNYRGAHLDVQNVVDMPVYYFNYDDEVNDMTEARIDRPEFEQVAHIAAPGTFRVGVHEYTRTAGDTLDYCIAALRNGVRDIMLWQSDNQIPQHELGAAQYWAKLREIAAILRWRR